jgi:hypothetical protein
MLVDQIQFFGLAEKISITVQLQPGVPTSSRQRRQVYG